MRKIVSICIVFLLIACMSTGTLATGDSSSKSIQEQKYAALVESFFTKQYTVYGLNGEDITESFYDILRPKYQSGDYAAIIIYLQQNVSYAEATVKEITPIMTKDGLRSSYDNIRVTRDFYQVVDDEIHGWEGHNAIDGEVVLNYVVNSNEGEIVSASAPTITSVDMRQHFGELAPEITVSNRRATVAANKLYAVFSFHVHAYQHVQDSTDPGVEIMNIAYEYNADFSFTEYAP